MEKFIQFVINHWMLWLALVVVLILLIYEETKGKLLGIKQLTAQDLTLMINRDQAVVIDTRDVAAFNQGHIIDSLSIPANELPSNLKKLDKYKEKTIVLVDNTGQSSAAMMQLKKHGYNAVVLAGGLNAWRNQGLPVTKK